jgi:hypothetical protein
MQNVQYLENVIMTPHARMRIGCLDVFLTSTSPMDFHSFETSTLLLNNSNLEGNGLPL